MLCWAGSLQFVHTPCKPVCARLHAIMSWSACSTSLKLTCTREYQVKLYLQCSIHCNLNLQTLFCDILHGKVEIRRALATSVSDQSNLFMMASDASSKQTKQLLYCQLSLAPAVSSVSCFDAVSVTVWPDRFNLNLDMSWGIAAMTGPNFAMLSCSSKRGTASSFKFLGTCRRTESVVQYVSLMMSCNMQQCCYILRGPPATQLRSWEVDTNLAVWWGSLMPQNFFMVWPSMPERCHDPYAGCHDCVQLHVTYATLFHLHLVYHSCPQSLWQPCITMHWPPHGRSSMRLSLLKWIEVNLCQSQG